jgi:hypothetical protein
MVRAFLDLEGSSLGRHSFPVEVAWVFEDGAEESHLIRPAPRWKEWQAGQSLHQIPLDVLEIDGSPVEDVARRLVDVLSGHEVYADAPAWDGDWLDILLRSAELSAGALQLVDIDAGLEELASAILAPSLPSSEIPRATRRILADASARFAGRPRARRALADARLSRERWLAVSALARAYRAEGGVP